jgi:phosphoserine phosphatase RsbU/P
VAAPALVMTKTNEMISAMPTVPMFATVFFGILDRRSWTLRYCNAGHPPALLKRGREILQLATDSPAIGVLPDLKFKERSVALAPGEILVLYTDGITEARRDRGLFGEERLERLVQELKGPAPAIPQQIFDEVMRYCGGVLADDSALLAISRR